ncbi:acyltransferase [Streptococcus alactolyticus]|uniref:acyltransferase n=1 Tax=Streptococcus alactolyticus TaxID=29389 RepID=UPI003F96592B
MTSLYTRLFASFGRKSVLYRPLYIKGKEFIHVGDNTTILNNARIQVYNDLTGLKSEVRIGNNCYIGYNTSILAGGNVEIGDGVLMASNILISSENHSVNPEDERYYSAQPLVCDPVKIDEGCWIGERVCILPGITIGKKCVVGAGSIVTKDIPDYCMVAGAPAKVIKKYDFEKHAWVRSEDQK